MLIQKGGDGEYYICRRSPGSSRQGGKKEEKVFRNWWLVKARSGVSGYVPIGTIVFPKEFLGKKVRFKIELVDGKVNEVKEIIKRISEIRKELNELKEKYVSCFEE